MFYSIIDYYATYVTKMLKGVKIYNNERKNFKDINKTRRTFSMFCHWQRYWQTLGIQEGNQQKQHDMILEMHKQGLPIDLISDISKLSESEVKEIINETNTKEKS